MLRKQRQKEHSKFKVSLIFCMAKFPHQKELHSKILFQKNNNEEKQNKTKQKNQLLVVGI